jgi:hypothetical protein
MAMRSGSGVLSAELWHRGAGGGEGRSEFASLGVQVRICRKTRSLGVGPMARTAWLKSARRQVVA